MARHFNTAGPCEGRKHYMLPPSDRLQDLRPLIDREAYFVIHAPRQTGKTTFIQWLANDLTVEGKYAAVVVNCKPAATAGDDVERGIDAVIEAIYQTVSTQLPAELRPKDPDQVARIKAELRLQGYLSDWCKRCARPVVLLLDEVDAMRDGTLLSVLNQLSAGYTLRPSAFPHSLALIGLRDVRDYKIERPNGLGYAGSASPFNIKSDSLRMRDFTAEEIATLYDQHTVDTGQLFTDEVKTSAFEMTRGQPWLVNALARQLVEEGVPDPDAAIEGHHLEAAKEALICRRDTHVDSLVDRLREDRVRRVLEPILAGEFSFDEVLDDDVQFAKDLGLVARGASGTLEIANPIYHEVIPRALTATTEEYLPVNRSAYIAADGSLLFDKLLDGFVAFWRQHAEHFLRRQPYSEAAAQLIFMAWLHRVVNGGSEVGLATIDREYAVGAGRIDLHVRWPLPDGGCQRFAVELKVWRDSQGDPLTAGRDQLADYLERLGLSAGTLVIFDQRSDAPPRPERIARDHVDHRGLLITLLRL